MERGTLSKGLFSYVQVLALALALVLVLVLVLVLILILKILGPVRDYGMAVLEVVSVAGMTYPGRDGEREVR